ncbi:MAG: tripartite tricarboxylate transporter substrate binding protein [Betaproteobacteria bacterium]|nr:tripartite tricarboxylate transporter substrate binding protein [Betaproteobacteria bacterium]
MSINLRSFSPFALLLVSIALIPLAGAATWPEKPVRILIPWPPGGSTDIVGRLLAVELTTRLKQQVIIDNRSGAGGIVGMQIATAAPPDGYTLMLTSTAYGYLIDKQEVPVDIVKSFAPVALIGLGESALAVHPALPVKSVKELIALARARPGELNYASSGIGGFPHMNTELLKLKTGVNMVHVPFKGGGPAIADVVAGHTQIYLGALVTVMPFIQSGRLKLLGVGGTKRNANLPNVATISETVPGYETYIWWGLFAPPATPAATIARLHAETINTLDSPGFVKRLDEQGGAPSKMSTADFGKLMVSETAKWIEVIKAAGIKGE